MIKDIIKSLQKNSNLFQLLGLISLITIVGTSCIKTKNKDLQAGPPFAEIIRKEISVHGHSRIDNYYWLNERDNLKVIEYLEEENRYLNIAMSHTAEFQEKLYHEIAGRIKKTEMSVPYKINGYYYYARYEDGEEYPLYCRKKGTLDAEEELVLNVPILAQGHNYFHVTGLSISPDNSLLAYGVDTVSRRQYTIHFMNLSTGMKLVDAIPNTTGEAAWADDNKTVFYTSLDEITLRHNKIMRHVLGQEVYTDREVFFEDDESFRTRIYKTKSKKYLIIASDSTLSDEYHFLEANQPDGKFRIFQKREPNLKYNIEHCDDIFYIRTNLDATNFKLMSTSINRTGKHNWTDIVPHREDVFLHKYEVFNDYLVLNERKEGLPYFRIIHLKDGSEHYLTFSEEAYVAYFLENPELDTEYFRYGYTSLATPESIYDYDMRSRTNILLKQEEVLGLFSPADYHTKRIYATAPDGINIPISLVYKKGIKRNSKNPLLLEGYGAYGSNEDPHFSSSRLSLLERGFIYGIAHVRGGGEMGRWWYEGGRLLNKRNTFTDFIACAKYLISEKYTNPEKLFAMGGSAGGLLIGAVINMRPDLFKGVVGRVPFVDIITTGLDHSIPLTTREFEEWGNPSIKEHYEYMLSYSPYDNIEEKDYPAILVTTGFHDSQVQYWEPAKWVAKLRASKKDDNPLLLYVDMESGHSGTSGRLSRNRLTAMKYAFLLELAGIRE